MNQTAVMLALLDACKAQHEAIDLLFAMLIDKTARDEKPFYPSACGQPWAALQSGRLAVATAERYLKDLS